MPSFHSVGRDIMAGLADFCIFIIDTLVVVYHLFDRLKLKFESQPPPPPPPGDGRRKRRPPSPAVSFGWGIIHFFLRVIELPVFLVVIILTVLLLTLLAAVELVLAAFFFKFKATFLVVLLLLGMYWLHTNGYIKNPMK